MSAIHFKANWQTQFNKELTTKQKFSGFSGEREVEMMNMRKKNIAYYETEQVQVASLPYANSSLRAVIVLPKDRSVEAF